MQYDVDMGMMIKDELASENWVWNHNQPPAIIIITIITV